MLGKRLAYFVIIVGVTCETKLQHHCKVLYLCILPISGKGSR